MICWAFKSFFFIQIKSNNCFIINLHWKSEQKQQNIIISWILFVCHYSEFKFFFWIHSEKKLCNYIITLQWQNFSLYQKSTTPNRKYHQNVIYQSNRNYVKFIEINSQTSIPSSNISQICIEIYMYIEITWLFKLVTVS